MYEDLIRELDKVMTNNRDYRRECNEVLNKVRSALLSQERSDKADYERGANDAWELGFKVCEFASRGGYSFCEILDIFEYKAINDVFSNYTGVEALNKVKAYEKKKEEAKKPVVGDVVELLSKTALECIPHSGILLADNEKYYHVLNSLTGIPYEYLKQDYTITKTGKHFDIRGMLDEIKTEG